ncbi:MAG: EscR/YscR/HrcR family type III secretion system export apparatus protein [Deltaproteobacteria bacterium]|nr:EscR/YscR/HrcR family type III secretion system export apparatus protein [Deltaproteobacteria bacterium]
MKPNPKTALANIQQHLQNLLYTVVGTLSAPATEDEQLSFSERRRFRQEEKIAQRREKAEQRRKRDALSFMKNSQLLKATTFFATLGVVVVMIALIPEVEAKRKAALAGTDLLGKDSISNRPLLLMSAMAAMALLPFVGMMVTSFVKMAVVLSITRQAIGTQQAPPTTVITGMAIILTVYVMQPVGLQIINRTENLMDVKNADFLDKENADLLVEAIKLAEKPVKDFLIKNGDEKNRQMFYRVAYRLRDAESRKSLDPNDFVLIVPAFVITELTKAFQIGFIIFVPFLVIDMVVSNILMALGMQMLSPTTISLPFKILLFVLVDGWYLITRGLVLGYQ